MLLRARDIPDGGTLRADACVVGAGPAGLTVAHALARAGREVLLLESGERRESEHAESLSAGVVEGGSYDGLAATRSRRVGGTAHRWNTAAGFRFLGARYLPIQPSVLSRWPLPEGTLDPWYLRAAEFAGIGAIVPAAGPWVPGPGLAGALTAAGLEIGTYWLGHRDRWTRELPREIHASTRVRLIPGATAIWLQLGESGRTVAGLEAATFTGSRFTVRARQVVLAGGAIENARLLLASVQASERAPGNAGGWLGRGFVEHPRDFSLRLEPDRALPAHALHWCDAHRDREGRRAVGHLLVGPEAREREHLPAFGVSVLPWRTLGAGLPRPFGGQPGYGWSRRRLHASWRGYRLVMNLEQHADRSNGVRLGPDLDPFGIPRAVLEWRWTDAEQEGLERARRWLGGALAAARLGRLVTEPGRRPDPNAHHHAGTTRMSAAPSDGVVDAECRVHGLANLHVAGASVFPLAGYANPMLTVVALALRLGEKLGALDDRA